MVFIFFAEDRSILPPNTIRSIIDHYKGDIEDRELWHFYKIYFKAINEGNAKLGIPEYNGGLFATDELLESLRIDNHVIEACPLALSAYDFNSDIDVNILGHIFENSLNDIEELKARIEDADFDAKQSKRKKDGVFYTPEYITKYIVDNTLGTLCQAKKEELGLDEVDIFIPKNPKKLNKGEMRQKEALEAYREYLLGLKILDPACGSGAFLNQALNYLLEEHNFIDESVKTLMGGSVLGLYDVKKGILENNLYGVDINAEAVEIAKLSLWLRTVESGRKLNKLADKIKVGNSLIDDKSVTEDAFVWEEEFSEVFAQGGFDCVIGNPPYIRVQGLKANYREEAEYYERRYQSAIGNYDIYVLFMEKSFALLNKTGKLSYILPHKFLISDFGKGIRSFFSENRAVNSLLHFGSEIVFKEASTYTCIITLSHNNENLYFKSLKPDEIFNEFEYDFVSYEKLDSSKWNLTNQKITKVLEQINKQPLKVKDIFSRIFSGIQTSGDNIYLLLQTQEGLYSKALDRIVEIEDGLLKPILKGDDISRYRNLSNQYFVIFPYLLEDDNAEPMSEEYIQNNFPQGYHYLQENEEFLRNREKGKMDKEGWFLYIYPKGLTVFEQPKIIAPDILKGMNLTYDDKDFCVKNGAYGVILKDEFKKDYKAYLAILNSSLMWFFIENTGTELRGGYFRFNTKYIEPFPLPKLENKEFLTKKAKIMLDLNKMFQNKKIKFLNRMTDNLNLDKLSKKLEAFYESDFKTFLKELKKKKVTLTLKDQDEWEEYFESYQKELLEIKAQIDATDKQIDEMVYELYGLSEDEVAVVEGRG